MSWPWVNRKNIDALRAAESRDFREKEARYQEREVMLRGAFERSERERTDLQLKLLRVGFGINPFAEMFVPETTGAPADAPDAPEDFTVRQGMSEEEVQTTFVREARAKYGDNPRGVRDFVEQRQADFYANRSRQQIVSTEDMIRAKKVEADILASIAEGQAAARAA